MIKEGDDRLSQILSEFVFHVQDVVTLIYSRNHTIDFKLTKILCEHFL